MSCTRRSDSPHPPSGPKIAVVGAGIIGRMLSLFLMERGLAVTLFDRDPIDQGRAAAWTGAGMLAPWAELEQADSEAFALGLRALALWPEVAESLGREAIDYRDTGSLLVAHAGDRQEYQRCLTQLRSRLPADQNDALKILDKSGLSELEPELADGFADALWLPNEAWVDGQRLMSTLATALLEQGVDWRPATPVRALSSQTVSTADETFRFDVVVDCRGMGAATDITELRGVRGEVLWLDAPEVHLSRPVRLLHPRYRLYMVPRRHHRYVLGATQIESEDTGPITVRSALELLSAAYTLHPGFAEARVVRTDANLRPAFDDHLPRIAVEDGLVRVNGLFRHGFLLAPAVASDAVECVLRLCREERA